MFCGKTKKLLQRALKRSVISRTQPPVGLCRTSDKCYVICRNFCLTNLINLSNRFDSSLSASQKGVTLRRGDGTNGRVSGFKTLVCFNPCWKFMGAWQEGSGDVLNNTVARLDSFNHSKQLCTCGYIAKKNWQSPQQGRMKFCNSIPAKTELTINVSSTTAEIN